MLRRNSTILSSGVNCIPLRAPIGKHTTHIQFNISVHYQYSQSKHREDFCRSVLYSVFDICQWHHTLVNTHMLMDLKVLPSAQVFPLKLHTQAFLVSHAYLTFHMAQDRSPLYFLSSDAPSYHSFTNARNLRFLELPFLSTHTLPLPSQASKSPSPLHCPSSVHHLLPGRWLQVCSLQIIPSIIHWHRQSRIQWSPVTCRIRFIKANTAL